MKRCSECPYGPRSPLSDVCDGCTSDGDTGWGGFMDHSIDKHFNTQKEQSDYYSEYDNDDSEDNITGWF